MKLKQAIIRNFRSVEEVVIDFVPSCRVLVGLNESGKSNILKALALLDGSTPSSSDLRRKVRGDPPIQPRASFVRFVFQLDDGERERVRKNTMGKILTTSKNPHIATVNEVRKDLAAFCSMSTYRDGLYNAYIQEETTGPLYWGLKSAELLDGWKAIPEGCQDYVEIREEEIPLADYKLVRISDFSDIEEGSLEDASIDDLTSIVGEQIREIVAEKLPEVRFWEYDKGNVLPPSKNIEEFKADPDSCMPLRNMFSLAGYENIAESIDAHYKEDEPQMFVDFLEDIADSTTRYFRGAWKEHRDVSFNLTYNGADIIPSILGGKTRYRMQDRSDGFKRFVTFMLMISAAVKADNLSNTLLLIDEPEIGLHPTGARYLRDELIKVSKSNHVVYSTHSIFMIDPDNIRRHCIVKKENEKTTVSREEGGNFVDEEVLYQALGFSVFGILKQKNIIFEGWRDKHLFEVALKKAAPETKESFKEIGRCHSRGAKGVGAITPMVELACRDYIVVSDSDEVAVECQTSHQKDNRAGGWFTYKEIVGGADKADNKTDDGIGAETGEDFLNDDYIVGVVNKHLGGTGSPAFAEDLPPTGKLGALCHWLIAKRIVSKQGVNAKANEIKEALFNGLKPAHINMPAYEKVLHGIVKRLAEVKPSEE